MRCSKSLKFVLQRFIDLRFLLLTRKSILQLSSRPYFFTPIFMVKQEGHWSANVVNMSWKMYLPDISFKNNHLITERFSILSKFKFQSHDLKKKNNSQLTAPFIIRLCINVLINVYAMTMAITFIYQNDQGYLTIYQYSLVWSNHDLINKSNLLR